MSLRANQTFLIYLSVDIHLTMFRMTGWAMTIPLLLLLYTTIVKLVVIQYIDIVNKDYCLQFLLFCWILFKA